MPCLRRRTANNERGSLAILLITVTLALFMIGGLVVDGSRLLTLRAQAQAYAEEAARAGASATAVENQHTRLDTSAMTSRVNAYCDRIGAENQGGVISCAAGNPQGLVVPVTVKLRTSTTLLGMFGVSSLDATGQAQARGYQGNP